MKGKNDKWKKKTMDKKIQKVVDKYKKYLPEIDFSVRGTPEERIAEDKRVYELIQPSLRRTLRKIL